MAKLPYMQFFPSDWIVDTRCLSLAARGAWIDILAFMWNSRRRGKITKSIDGFAQMLGVFPEEVNRCIEEFQSHKIANVKRECNGDVTIVSRRQQREEREREMTRKRVLKHRQKIQCNGNVRECNTDISESEDRIRSQKTESERENTVTGASVSSVGFSEKVQETAFRVLGTVPPATLAEWIVTYGEEWTNDALVTAEQAGKKRSAYVTGILKRWAAEGRDQKQAEEPKKRDPVFEYLEKRGDRAIVDLPQNEQKRPPVRSGHVGTCPVPSGEKKCSGGS